MQVIGGVVCETLQTCVEKSKTVKSIEYQCITFKNLDTLESQRFSC